MVTRAKKRGACGFRTDCGGSFSDGFFQESMTSAGTRDVEAAWRDEIDRRLAGVLQGRVRLVSAEESQRHIQSALCAAASKRSVSA